MIYDDFKQWKNKHLGQFDKELRLHVKYMQQRTQKVTFKLTVYSKFAFVDWKSSNDVMMLQD